MMGRNPAFLSECYLGKQLLNEGNFFIEAFQLINKEEMTGLENRHFSFLNEMGI